MQFQCNWGEKWSFHIVQRRFVRRNVSGPPFKAAELLDDDIDAPEICRFLKDERIFYSDNIYRENIKRKNCWSTIQSLCLVGKSCKGPNFNKSRQTVRWGTRHSISSDKLQNNLLQCDPCYLITKKQKFFEKWTRGNLHSGNHLLHERIFSDTREKWSLHNSQNGARHHPHWVLWKSLPGWVNQKFSHFYDS